MKRTKSSQRGFISEADIVRMFVVLVLFGVAIGALVFLGLPWLWELMKPVLHAVTAR